MIQCDTCKNLVKRMTGRKVECKDGGVKDQPSTRCLVYVNRSEGRTDLLDWTGVR